MEEKGRTRREGVTAGLIGATAVALWFFVADLIAGQPLYTPIALGSALQGFFGATSVASAPLTVLMYTVFHYLAFILVGLIVSAVFNAAEREPSILAGFAILFVMLELASLGLVVLVQESSVLRSIAWYQIGAANLVASISMGTYLVRAHRGIMKRVGLSIGGI
ncbi:MAG: hypothetical protein ABIZ91_12065 [Gemmatimonadaceae bacterium]